MLPSFNDLVELIEKGAYPANDLIFEQIGKPSRVIKVSGMKNSKVPSE